MANSTVTHSQPLTPPNHKTCDDIVGHPHILTVRGMDPEVPAEIYNRSLILTGHGIPLFTPGFKGDKRVPKPVAQRGLAIGDVGVVDRTNGAFEYFFNVFLPKEHPEQYKIPDSFIPFEPPPQESQIKRVANYHKAGTIVVSSGIEIRPVEDNIHHFTYATEAEDIEGAILVLPQGASREDILDPSVLDEYVSQHATKWYQHINPYGDPYFTNGTLTVVTGYDKARDWATAVFPTRLGEEKASGEYKYVPGGRTSGTLWANMTNSTGTSQQLPQNIHNEAMVEGSGVSASENQCMFVRGTTISINNHIWPKLHASYLGSGPFHAIIRLERTSLRKTLDSVKDKFGIRTDIGMIEEDKARAAARGPNQVSGTPDVDAGFRPHLQESYSFSRHFQLARLFSSSWVESLFDNDTTLKYDAMCIVVQFPQVNVVLVNDSCWCQLVEACTCAVDEVNDLVSRVFESHEVSVTNDALTLAPRPDRKQISEKDDKKKIKQHGPWADYSRLKHAGF